MSGQIQNPPLGLSLSNHSKTFKCAHYANNFLEKLHTFQQEKDFVDIALISEIDKFKIQVHRIVLTASSAYFLGMFRCPLKESKATEIELKEIDGSTLALLVEFMYTGLIELRNDNIESIVRAADFFGMNTLIATCCVFMEEQVAPNNCLGIALLAEQYGLTQLHKKASTFAAGFFEAVCKEREFLDLSDDELVKLICRADLRVTSEEKVFFSLLAWIEFEKENREKQIFKLFSHVEFKLLKPEFIEENKDSICKSVECHGLVRSWLQWHMSDTRSESATSIKREKLAFASGSSTLSFKIQTYNPELDCWSLEDLPRPSRWRVVYSSIAINNKIIIVGGEIANCFATKSVECLDLLTKQWTDLPPMGLGRCLPGLTELNGDLYVVGGSDSTEWCTSVEKYDFSTGKWEDVAPMPIPFKYVKLAVADGLLYAVGKGFYNMICYDPAVDIWTFKTFKNEKSEVFAFAGVSGHLYAVGGVYDGRMTDTFEEYHPPTDTWTTMKPLGMDMQGVRCIDYNNRLIACKGCDSPRTEVELTAEYEANGWITLPHALLTELIHYNSSTLFKI